MAESRTEFARTDFGGAWIDTETGEATCEITLDAGDGHTFVVDVWRLGTGTVTYRDVIVLPAHGIPEFGLENDIAVQVGMPGHELPVAVCFGTIRSRGTRDADDHGELFFRTFVDALESGYEGAVRRVA